MANSDGHDKTYPRLPYSSQLVSEQIRLWHGEEVFIGSVMYVEGFVTQAYVHYPDDTQLITDAATLAELAASPLIEDESALTEPAAPTADDDELLDSLTEQAQS
jgi:hypothetical protein